MLLQQWTASACCPSCQAYLRLCELLYEHVYSPTWLWVSFPELVPDASMEFAYVRCCVGA